jgi:glutamate dehydrogenase/leucine dehydrogenase
MPTNLDGVHVFKGAKILFARQGGDASGVGVSGLEMSQNSARISWKEEEPQKLLIDIMKGIHDSCVEYGGTRGSEHIDYVRAPTSPASRKWPTRCWRTGWSDWRRFACAPGEWDDAGSTASKKSPTSRI